MEKIEVIVRASSLHDNREIARLKQRLLRDIGIAGEFDLQEVERPSGEGLAAVLVLTGGVERELLKLVPQLPSPTLLIAHPGHNSLPACLEILARIRRNGEEGQILFGSPEAIAHQLTREAQIASAWNELRFSRVGLIGAPSDWLVASDVDRAFLKGRLGIELVPIKMDELIERINSVKPAKKEIVRLTTAIGGQARPNKEVLEQAVAIYTALRGLVEKHRLAACTVRCFDLISRRQNTSCYALSRLNDEGIPAGCEGDLQALFSLYIAMLFSQKAAFMGNIASVDTATQKIVLAHCSCPLSLGTKYSLGSHFESGIGVGISVTIPAGPATLFRFGGERLDQLFIREGTIEQTSHRDDLCRTQVAVSLTEPIDELLSAPLGNHHILFSGHQRESIERFFKRYLRP